MHQGPNTSYRSFESTKDRFTLLGSEQNSLDGHTQHRIGRQIFVEGTCSLRDLYAGKREQRIAAGLVPIYSDHESLRVYGTSRDTSNNIYDFKMVIENNNDGLVYAEVCVMKGGEAVDTIEGFVTVQDNSSGSQHLEELSSETDNVITIHTRNGFQHVNLGKVDYLIVDCGVIAREDPARYRTTRDHDVLSVYLAGDLAASAGEFHNIPITTIKQSQVAIRFSPTLDQHLLPDRFARGYVAPTPKPTGLGFSR